MQSLADTYAAEFGVNAEHLKETIAHESGWKNVKSNFDEESVGVCQINLDYHPEISSEQAWNPRFCIKWMAEQFSKGHAYWWVAWRCLYTENCPVKRE